MTTVIIGAGLAGLTAARVLQGKDVILLDKGKSAGGRLATRRIGNGKADHGAQFFTVRTKELQSAAEDWLKSGLIKKWFGDHHPRYIGVNGMNSIAKYLAEGLDVRTDTEAIKVSETEKGYRIDCRNGEVFTAEYLLITAPAPQAAALLEAGGIKDTEELKNIVFNPCYTAMLTLKEAQSVNQEGHLQSDLPEGIERIADQSRKGISKEPIVSVYTTGKWAKQHENLEAEEVLKKMLFLVKEIVPADLIEEVQLKRWRYAEAEKPYPQSYLELEKKVPLLVAGDAFLRSDDSAGKTRFESAYISGLDAGERLLEIMR
ncbi:FAD-dependent oxidoreductase [Metabacillus sp. GX 13764]|uniref:NAD(P)/FAD-dependent oxidoreductase n=1 Tax=Metabacillus kandeliae TaxID=2900151 RepID=UPI001E5039B8|nr:FAD-dependent oxidoreductase [Metabacillus kandeliae]MCD7035233.1 FAD-dependent oxidoreductase [Metabacillus kandeliae]